MPFPVAYSIPDKPEAGARSFAPASVVFRTGGFANSNRPAQRGQAIASEVISTQTELARKGIHSILWGLTWLSLEMRC